MVKRKKLECGIPIHLPVSSSSSYKQNSQLGNDFYTWVNKEWMKKTEIPPFRPDFGVSEEVELCIFNASEKILADVENSSYRSFFKELRESCLTSSHQKESVQYLKISDLFNPNNITEISRFNNRDFYSFINNTFTYT